jgi:hypothetical protein
MSPNGYMSSANFPKTIDKLIDLWNLGGGSKAHFGFSTFPLGFFYRRLSCLNISLYIDSPSGTAKVKTTPWRVFPLRIGRTIFTIQQYLGN